MDRDTDLQYLRRSIELADEAVAAGNHPFGCLLVDANGTVLAEGGNNFSVDRGPGHAETNLVRRAARELPVETLREATLYTAVEPCCMCAGSIYWAEVGTVVFGMDETRLAELTAGDDENTTLALPCRTVFAAGGRPIEVRGPYPELESEIAPQHEAYWNNH